MSTSYASLVAAAVQEVAESSAPIKVMAQLSHHLDEAEALADAEFFTIAKASKPALCNLLTRISRLQLSIQSAARK